MEITASCKFDYNSIRALCHSSLYRIFAPKFTFGLTCVCVAVTAAISVLGLLRNPSSHHDVTLLAVALVLMALNFYLYFGLPRLQYRALGKLQSTENHYVFLDDTLKVTSSNATYRGEGEYAYATFTRVRETSDYLFLFLSARQVFVVDKSTVAGGTVEQIRDALRPFIKYNYTTCKF